MTWISVLVDAAAKGFLVLALAGMAVLCLRRASAALRHLVWFVALASLLLLPMLSMLLPGWPILPQWIATQSKLSEASPQHALAPDMRRSQPSETTAEIPAPESPWAASTRKTESEFPNDEPESSVATYRTP